MSLSIILLIFKPTIEHVKDIPVSQKHSGSDLTHKSYMLALH